MDGDLGEKIRQILGDKDAMEKITSIASGLGKPLTAQNASPAAPVLPKNEKAALLAALRPLLREEKRSKIDAMQTALTLAALFESYKKHSTE